MIDYKKYFEEGFTYTEYMQKMDHELKSNHETQYSKYIPINFQRSKRIEKTVIIDSSLLRFTTKFKWLVISEHWCGDASQILPVINKIADSSNGYIELKIVYRDENEELMNQHLTNGSKSIPKLIQLNENFKLIAEWGPRPRTAQELVVKLKSNPENASNYSEELHKWYAQDKQNEIIKELCNLINLSGERKPISFVG